jgi:dihydroneopterin aldolase
MAIKKQFALEIKDYPVFVRLGCFPEEKKNGQTVFVTLKAQLSITPGDSDLLSQTLDYGKLLQKIDLILMDQKINLIETAVNRLGDHLLGGFPQIKHLWVSIHKPVLPSDLGKGAKISVSGDFLNQEEFSKSPATC